MPDTSASNFATLTDALAAVQAHPLCQAYQETPTQFVVFYPPIYTIPGGASVQRGNDELAAMTLLYARLQDFWNAQRLQVAKS